MTQLRPIASRVLTPDLHRDFGVGLRNVTSEWIRDYPDQVAQISNAKEYTKLNANLDLAEDLAVKGDSTRAAKLRRCRNCYEVGGANWAYTCGLRNCYFCSSHKKKSRTRQVLDSVNDYATKLDVKSSLVLSHCVVHPMLHLSEGISVRTAQREAAFLTMLKEEVHNAWRSRNRDVALKALNKADNFTGRADLRAGVPGVAQSAVHLWMEKDTYRAFNDATVLSPESHIPSLHMHFNFITYRKPGLAKKTMKDALDSAKRKSKMRWKHLDRPHWKPVEEYKHLPGSRWASAPGKPQVFAPGDLQADHYGHAVVDAVSYLAADYKLKYDTNGLTDNAQPKYRVWTDFWRDALLTGVRHYSLLPKAAPLTNSAKKRGSNNNSRGPGKGVLMVRDGKYFAFVEQTLELSDKQKTDQLGGYLYSKDEN